MYDLEVHTRLTAAAFDWCANYALKHAAGKQPQQQFGAQAESLADPPEPLADPPELPADADPIDSMPRPSPGWSATFQPVAKRAKAACEEEEYVIELILGATVADGNDAVYHKIKWQGWTGDWFQRSPTVPGN